MEGILLFILGLFISIVLILVGIILIYYNNNMYEKTLGIIDETECVLDRNIKNFVYNCEIKLYHIIENKKYINFKKVKTSIIPYRKYDKIDIWYNKNDPSEIIMNNSLKNIYIYIPIILGIILFILIITLYLIFGF
tara:strand:- start:16171 stop:16578 length:408 start_codon:yes stop_codon:yes gene_type:complete